VVSYRFETSDDGTTWTVQSEGTFGNMVNNPVRQEVHFSAVKTRWFRFTGLSDTTGGKTIRAAEISAIASGFDAWKRDRGQQSLLPNDNLNGTPALIAYYWGGPRRFQRNQQSPGWPSTRNDHAERRRGYSHGD
jgi:hypothetical protein